MSDEPNPPANLPIWLNPVAVLLGCLILFKILWLLPFVALYFADKAWKERGHTPATLLSLSVQTLAGLSTAWSALPAKGKQGAGAVAGAAVLFLALSHLMRPVVEGTLVDGLSGEPLAELSVVLEDAEENCSSEVVVTDAEGRFAIDTPDCEQPLRLFLEDRPESLLVGLGLLEGGESAEIESPVKSYPSVELGVSLLRGSTVTPLRDHSLPAEGDSPKVLPLALPEASGSDLLIILSGSEGDAAGVKLRGLDYADGELSLAEEASLTFLPTSDGRLAAVTPLFGLPQPLAAILQGDRMTLAGTSQGAQAAPDCSGLGLQSSFGDQDPITGHVLQDEDHRLCGAGLSVQTSSLQTLSSSERPEERLLLEGRVSEASSQGCPTLQGADRELQVCGLPFSLEAGSPVLLTAYQSDSGGWTADALYSIQLAEGLAHFGLLDRLQRDRAFRSRVDEAAGVSARATSKLGRHRIQVESPADMGIEDKYRLAAIFPASHSFPESLHPWLQRRLGRTNMAEVHADTQAWDEARLATLAKLTSFERAYFSASKDRPKLHRSWFMPTNSPCGTEAPGKEEEAQRAELRAEVLGARYQAEASLEVGEPAGLSVPLKLSVDDVRGLALGGSPAFIKIPQYDCECCNVFSGVCEPPYDGFFSAFWEGVKQGVTGSCSCSGKDGMGWAPRRVLSDYTEEWNDEQVLAKSLRVNLRSYSSEDPPSFEAEVVYTVDRVVRHCADTSAGERFVGRILAMRVLADDEPVLETSSVTVSDAEILAPPSTGELPVTLR